MQRGGMRSGGAAAPTHATRSPIRLYRMACLLFALAGAGCTTTGQTVGSTGNSPSPTVALVSLEGAPPDVLRKFARNLDAEAAAHRITVAPRGSAVQYQIRSYLAAHEQDGARSIAWVWDVYDPNLRHVFRLSGDETAGAARGKAWSAADDQALHRIARNGMQQLSPLVGTAELAPEHGSAPPRSGRSLWALAGLDDFKPETFGIFRVFGAGSDTAVADATESQPAAVPLPRPRPRARGGRALAYASDR